ncbi:hypothetical protein GCM10029992_62010 [Glycomyces albus]
MGQDVETELGAQFGQPPDVSGGLVAEAEVLADDDRVGVEPVDQHAADERLRALQRELLGERQDAHAVDAERAEQFDAPVEAREPGRHRVRGDHGGRMRVEGDRHGPTAALGGGLDGGADQGRVAAVHPVEHPDGDHRRRPSVGSRLDSSPGFHAVDPLTAGGGGAAARRGGGGGR